MPVIRVSVLCRWRCLNVFVCLFVHFYSCMQNDLHICFRAVLLWSMSQNTTLHLQALRRWLAALNSRTYQVASFRSDNCKVMLCWCVGRSRDKQRVFWLDKSLRVLGLGWCKFGARWWGVWVGACVWRLAYLVFFLSFFFFFSEGRVVIAWSKLSWSVLQPGAVKLVLWHHWMRVAQVHPVTSPNQFHCTRLYVLLTMHVYLLLFLCFHHRLEKVPCMCNLLNTT